VKRQEDKQRQDIKKPYIIYCSESNFLYIETFIEGRYKLNDMIEILALQQILFNLGRKLNH
jgi:hypothetical protein